MRVANRSHGRILLTTATLVVASFWALNAQGPGGRGRGNPAASLPTPRLADGTVNFGRVPGEKGIWNVPYITNMGMRVVDDTGPAPDGVVVSGDEDPLVARAGELGDHVPLDAVRHEPAADPDAGLRAVQLP